MTTYECRACRGQAGDLVLDLGEQPACDYFPKYDEPGPDPVYPLQMWLCAACGLAQLLADPTVPEEPKGAEPAALVEQAAEAVRRVTAAGLLPPDGRVSEYGSPHGGSWLGLLSARGLRPVDDTAEADVILDCFGMMHAADQAAALAERAARVAAGGVLLVQYHSLATIVRSGQWNALRHGHYAYYSTTALTQMLAGQGFCPRTAWSFDLYGGTVLLAARRVAEPDAGPGESVTRLLMEDELSGVRDPGVLSALESQARAQAQALRDYLTAERAAGRTVIGYGAASRAVALLRWAKVDSSLLSAVVDASPAKQGLRLPGSDVPIVSPAQLTVRKPDAVLLFLADLRAEVRAAYPEVEASGARWVDAESLGAVPSNAVRPAGP